MKIKRGATLAGLDIRMRKALIITDEVYEEHGKELVITSGLDSAHRAGSLHYYGLAFDTRIRYFSVKRIEEVVRNLRRKLPICYQLIQHKNHLHIEFDEWRQQR